MSCCAMRAESSAQTQAHRHFALPFHRPRQQKRGHINTGDHQNERRRAKSSQQRQTDVSDQILV